jgi:regulatory protein
MRPDSPKTAIQYAMGKLSRRFYSRRIMKDMLTEAGYGAASVEDALARLEQWGYLDDLKLARNQLRRYTIRQPKGKLWIRRRLVLEGFEPDVVRQVLEEYTDDQESELAWSAARRFLRSGSGKPVAALARFLANRGFSSRVIREIEFRFHRTGDLDSDSNWH